MKNSGCMPSASATTRSALAPKATRLGQVDNTFDRKPCATQAVTQGFPTRTYADGMCLHQPPRNGFIAGGVRSDPKRSEPLQESPSLFLCRGLLPKIEQRRRSPCG